MWRGVTFSAGFHVAITAALLMELPLFNEKVDIVAPPAIQVDFADISEIANLPKAGQEAEEEPEQPVNELPPPPPPSTNAPPPPPPPSKVPEPPKVTAKTPKPPVSRPAPPKPKTRTAAKTTPERRLERDKVAVTEALDKLPVPVKRIEKKPEPKPEPAVAKPVKPVEEPPKKAEVKTASVKPAKVTGNSKERTKKRSFEDRMAAVVDRLNKNKPRPKDPVTDKRNRLDNLVIGNKGASRTNPVGRLTLTEKMWVRGQLSKNWTVNKGAPNADQMWVVVKFELSKNGHLVSGPDVVDVFEAGQKGRVFNAFANSALRAVQRSTPFAKLPVEKYQTWRVMEVRFSLADMFG